MSLNALKELTPYQGRSRCFGNFHCKRCGNKWGSRNSWANVGQQCRRCHGNVHPYRLVRLTMPATNKKAKTKSSYSHFLNRNCNQVRPKEVACIEPSDNMKPFHTTIGVAAGKNGCSETGSTKDCLEMKINSGGSMDSQTGSSIKTTTFVSDILSNDSELLEADSSIQNLRRGTSSGTVRSKTFAFTPFGEKWKIILRKGLSTDETGRLEHGLVSRDTIDLSGPQLNPEITDYISGKTRESDNELLHIQNNISIGLKGIGSVILSLLADESLQYKNELICKLCDTCRYLSQVHHNMSQYRRKQIIFSVENRNVKKCSPGPSCIHFYLVRI